MANEWAVDHPAPGVWAVTSDRWSQYEIVDVDGDTLRVSNPNVKSRYGSYSHIDNWPAKVRDGLLMFGRCQLPPVPVFAADQTGASIVAGIRRGWRPALHGAATRPTGIGVLGRDQRPRQYWNETHAIVHGPDGPELVPARWDTKTLAAQGWQELLDATPR